LPSTDPAGLILVTRPLPGADETMRRLEAMGLHPVLAPVLQVASLTPRLPPPQSLQAVLVSSGNALVGLPEAYFDLKLLAVGDATAARAGLHGFRDVRSAGRDAAALAALAGEICVPQAGALLLASGLGQGATLAARLRAGGFRVFRRSLYAARPVAALPPAAETALRAGTLRAALFFSPATARAFVTLLAGATCPLPVETVDALAISARTSAALRVLPWHSIRVASRPNQDELLALLR
jgi:uroporphyrinogen-III synthase